MPGNDFYEEEMISQVEEDDIVAREEFEEQVTEGVSGKEFIYDQVKGGHGKRHVLSDLNKKKLGHHEMDEMFCDWF